MVFPNQTHSGTVRIIANSFFGLDEDERKRFLAQTDAVITNIPEACLAVKTADCVPVLLFDSKRKVVAAVHAGWRGTAQNIVSKTIQCMTEEFGTEPSDLFAGIGPSISPEIYEVGVEVWKQFETTFYHPISGKDDKRLLDLWSANFHDLINAGVPAGQIEIARICTLADPVHFFSARRDGAKTGRMATGIMLR
jgi:YfiH family protein